LRTADTTASNPPLSGTRNTTSCRAPSGTVNASAFFFAFHVSALKNHDFGGGSVAPRRNAATSR